jgi:cation transport ATPase
MTGDRPISVNARDRHPADAEAQRESHPDAARPAETEAERDDRNFMELLQELRVAALGVQVLFGFMLALPFTTKFEKLSGAQRGVYVATLVLAAVSTALLMAPVAYHRLVFRHRKKGILVKDTNIMAFTGLATVGLAISGAVLLVVSYVDRGAPVVIIPVFIVCLFAVLWFVLPLVRRRTRFPE